MRPEPGFIPNPFKLENPAILDIGPPEPKSLEETGLKIGLLSDMALRYLYYQGGASTRAAPSSAAPTWAPPPSPSSSTTPSSPCRRRRAPSSATRTW